MMLKRIKCVSKETQMRNIFMKNMINIKSLNERLVISLDEIASEEL